MKKILLNLWMILGFISAHSANIDWKTYQNEVLSHQSTLQGWCTKEKATRMMNLIHEINPMICVEIGVFGGASIYPTACALKFQDQGTIYAIDPWENSDCLEGYAPNDPNYQWL